MLELLVGIFFLSVICLFHKHINLFALEDGIPALLICLCFLAFVLCVAALLGRGLLFIFGLR
jgi:hypothetical protein